MTVVVVQDSTQCYKGLNIPSRADDLDHDVEGWRGLSRPSMEIRDCVCRAQCSAFLRTGHLELLKLLYKSCVGLIDMYVNTSVICYLG